MNPAGKGTPAVWVGIAHRGNIAPACLPLVVETLGPRDSRRYAHFGSSKRRQTFLYGRCLLRYALSARLGKSGDYLLDSQPSGAPCITLPEPGAPPHISLSHSGDWYACALSDMGSVGIDIEVMIDRDFNAMDEMAFYEEGDPPLRSLPETRRRETFYRRWTRAEARFKTGLPAVRSVRDMTFQSSIVHAELMLTVCLARWIAPTVDVMEWLGRDGFIPCEAACAVLV